MQRLHQLNRIHRNIPRILQKDAHPSYAESALQKGLSTTICKERVAGTAAYIELLGETLLTLLSVQESSSYVVIKQVKETLALEV